MALPSGLQHLTCGVTLPSGRQHLMRGAAQRPAAPEVVKQFNQSFENVALPSGPSFRAHCTAPCAAEARPAWQWREEWDAQLRGFVEKHAEGREWKATMEFIRPYPMDDFIWNVY